MMSQNSVPYNEQDSKNILEDLFEHSELTKEELQHIFEIISNKYI